MSLSLWWITHFENKREKGVADLGVVFSLWHVSNCSKKRGASLTPFLKVACATTYCFRRRFSTSLHNSKRRKWFGTFAFFFSKFRFRCQLFFSQRFWQFYTKRWIRNTIGQWINEWLISRISFLYLHIRHEHWKSISRWLPIKEGETWGKKLIPTFIWYLLLLNNE